VSEANNRAIRLSQEGRLDSSIELFLNLLNQNPNDPIVNYNLALVYIKKGYYKNAIPLLIKSVEIDPNDENLNQLGNCYINRGELDLAKETLLRATKEFGSSDSENSLGVCYFLGGDFNSARAHFKLSVELDENNDDAWYNLSDTLKELGLNREAKKAYKKFIDIGKRDEV